VPLARDLVGLDVVTQPVAEHRLSARAQFGLAACLHPLLADALESIGAQKDGLAGGQRRRLRRLNGRRFE